MNPSRLSSIFSNIGRSAATVTLFIALVCGAFIIMNTSGPASAAQESAEQNAMVQNSVLPNSEQGFVMVNSTQRACPDTVFPVLTATATRQVAPTATRNAPTTPLPRVISSSGLFEVTQEAMFNVNHTIWEFDPGLIFGPISYLGPVNIIVEAGEITYCSGRYQRLYKVGEAFSLPANLAFQLANSSSIVTRLSVVRIRPLGTPTPTGTVTETKIPTATGTVAPGAQGYLGIRVVSLNGTLKIVQFLQNSPVATVLRVDDVITALNDQPLTSLLSSTSGDVDYALITAFFDTIAARRPGETVTLTVQRAINGNTDTLTIPVTLGVNPAS